VWLHREICIFIKNFFYLLSSGMLQFGFQLVHNFSYDSVLVKYISVIFVGFRKLLFITATEIDAFRYL